MFPQARISAVAAIRSSDRRIDGARASSSSIRFGPHSLGPRLLTRSPRFGFLAVTLQSAAATAAHG